MKIKFTIIAVFLFPVLVSAQAFQIDKPALSIDSLKKVLPSLNDSARVDCLNELARSYLEKWQWDSAKAKMKLAYNGASSINYTKGLGDACIQHAMLYQWHYGGFTEAEKYYREAVLWYKKIQHDDGLGHAYRGLGQAIRNLRSWDEARTAFEQSALYYGKTGNQIMLADLTDNFSLFYGAKGDFEKEFEYVKKALKEKLRIKDNRGLIRSYYRLAHIYQSIGDYETALAYFRQSFQQALSQSVTWRTFRSMGNLFLSMENYDSSLFYFRQGAEMNPPDIPCLAGLGKLFILSKEYDKALHYLESALTGFKETKTPGSTAWVLADMGKAYAGKKNYTAALQYAREGFAIAQQINARDVLQNVYEIYLNVYQALQQKDSANLYFRKFVTLKDSLEDAKFKLQHLQKLALYKAEAKEEQQQARIDLLNKDNQIKQQKLQREALMKKILIGSFVALILLSIILFRNAALKRKNEKHRRELVENDLQIQKLESERTKAELQQQATELEMQALRAQMNPHFIFNCLSSINRFILKNESETASDYLTKFSRLIRMVLNNSNKSLIILEDELEMLRLYLDLERLRFKNSFDYSITFHNNFDAASIFIPPLLLQPFAENAIWHGLMHKEGQGILDVSFELENNILNCYITDNGVGRKKAEALKSKSSEKQKSMGMQITAERLALFNKDVEKTIFSVEDLIDSEGQAAGTRVTLKIRYKDSVEEYITN
jgi:tetratricopeptide (TPR) repeat protein